MSNPVITIGQYVQQWAQGNPMITVGEVAAADELHLQVAAGGEALDAEVTMVHVSELTDPHEWLRGGELLMTIGLLVEMTEQGCREYVRNCRAGGVAGLVLGLGPRYAACPEPLRAAAAEIGVPLLVVPVEVPFIAITKWVFEKRAAQQRHDLEEAMELNRRLTAVATSSAPLPALLETWAEASSAHCVVCDGVGRLIAASPGGSEQARTEAVELAVAASREPPGQSWVLRAGREIHTVGSGVALAFIVLDAQLNPVARHSSTVLVSLLALEVQRRHVAGQPERQRRGAVFAQLVRPGLKPARAQQLADSLGWRTTLVVAAVIAPAPHDADALLFRLQSSLTAGLVRSHGRLVEIAHPESDGLLATLTAIAPGTPIGLGAPVAVASLPVSLTQARSLVGASERLGRPVDAREGRTVELLIGLGEPRLLRGFADAVLAPIDQLEERERVELMRTLEEWLRVNGAWDPAAARLSVHRNTVRNRIDRIATLSGRRLDDGEDRMELWLALKARSALPRV